MKADVFRKLGVRALPATAMLLGGSFAAVTQGAVITMDVNNVWNGTSPTGATPYLRAQFGDTSPGTVTLMLSALNLSTNKGNAEDVQDWFFNLDPALDPSKLTFSPKSQVGSFTAPTITDGAQDSVKTQGNVPFDVDFGFATGNPSDRFVEGDSITYTVTYSGAGAFDADSFAFTTSKSPFGPFYTSAHIQNTGSNGNGSGDISGDSIPEPASGGIIAASFGFALFFRRRNGARRQQRDRWDHGRVVDGVTA
jgi:hypothetical protein